MAKHGWRISKIIGTVSGLENEGEPSSRIWAWQG